MVKYLCNALIWIMIFSFLGCDNVNRKDIPKSESKENSNDRSASSPSPQPRNKISDSERNIAETSAQIKAIRASAHPSEAIRAMFSLFHEWNPKGKTIDELKSQIGQPSRIQGDRYEYILWENASGGSMGGGEFIFYIIDGRIDHYEANPLQ